MDKDVDSKLLEMLNILQIGSRLRTSLNIKLSDYASQLCGFRSSRQIPGDKKDEVEDMFIELSNLLWFIANECVDKIKQDHKYKDIIYDLTDLDLELLLEDTLYDCVFWNDVNIFSDRFLIKT